MGTWQKTRFLAHHNSSDDTLKYLVQCAICKADFTQFIDLFTGRDRFHEIEGEFHVQTCGSCGIVFLNPQPTFDEIRKYYPDNYYSYHQTIERTIVTKLHDKLKRLFYARGFPLANGTRVLDIGCGNGEKLSEFLALGADCYGVEINEKAVEVARSKGIKAYHGDLFGQDFEEKFFDVVIMDNVFEHMAEPGRLLTKVYALLKDDGTLVITVPNRSSFTRFIFGKQWIGYQVPQHFFTYSPRTLKIVAQRNGFILEKIRHVQNSYQFLASLRFMLRSFSKFWKLPSDRSVVFDNSILKSIVFFLLFPFNVFRCGDAIKVFFTKK